MEAAHAVLGVIVPCRNEARVLGRKLENLARAAWPAAPRPHRLVVVDDGSEDGTAEVARAACARLFRDGAVSAEVAPNRHRPGKSGAIRTGLEALGSDVDLAVLTDADVVVEAAALEALEGAFRGDPRLGLACGAQRFVRDLAADGTCRGADQGEAADAAGLYDRITALVRRFESASGRLFSVHGQLLAWRASLRSSPTPGMAADDLDLMLQARARGARIALVRGARFLEVKLPPGPEREAQEERRARAYVQFLSHPRFRELTSRGDLSSRAQALLYRALPTSAPWLALAGAALAVALAWRALGPAGGAAAVALGLALGASSVGRRLARLMAVIARAVRRESRTTLADRWDTPRGAP